MNFEFLLVMQQMYMRKYYGFVSRVTKICCRNNPKELQKSNKSPPVLQYSL